MSGLAGQSVVVLGLGVSGRAAARALVAAGAGGLVVVDTRDSDAVRRHARELGAEGIDVRTGVEDPRVVAGADVLVASPGVAPSNPLLAAALASRTRVWSEPELAWRLNGGRTRVVAVTGTNGKTTTTELLGACLLAPVAGNIGPPMCDLLAGPGAPPLAVVELSSFQLRFAEELRADVGVLLNVAADHLDWHGSQDDYVAAKARVWHGQRTAGSGGLGGQDWAVVGVDDPGARQAVAAHPPPAGVVEATAAPPRGGQVGVRDGVLVSRVDGDVEVVAVGALGARGPHNLANALAAVAAAVCAGADPATLRRPLEAFRPGPHRLEPVAEVAGVRYVNDSKATNPHAAAAALASVGVPDAPRVVWIAGGLDKGLDFTALAGPVRELVRVAVTVGRAGPTLAALARGLGVRTVEAGTIGEAVRRAAALAEPGETVLLAPACASMDQFPDYAARGEAFREAVAALTAATAEVRDG